MENITITLNQEEINTFMALLDLANKTEGLKVAEACIHFKNKVEQSVAEFNNNNAPAEATGELVG
ncbi:MAG: hypothetical protein ACXACW_05190 [Candidatus Hodarchaeales archaeon]|jgi:hypothetical protein